MTKKDPSRVRARALVHMQRMLATSAAAMAVNEAACHRGDKTSDAGTDATAFGPPAVDANSPAAILNGDGPDANGVVTDRTHGYAVVDPMPMPAHCPDVAEKVKATATKSGENVVLRMSNAGGFSGFKYLKEQQPIAYLGTHVKHSVEANGTMVITMTPNAAGNVRVSVRGSCNKGLATLTASVGSDLKVTVDEY